jgi:hypothetical protein
MLLGDHTTYSIKVEFGSQFFHKLDLRPKMKELVGAQWSFGAYDDAFPELYALTRNISALDITDLEAHLTELAQNRPDVVTVLGISVAITELRIWGLVVLLVTQLYFLLHLRELTRRLCGEIDDVLDWAPLFPGWSNVGLFCLTTLLLPVSIFVWYLIGSVGSDGARWPTVVHAVLLLAAIAIAGLSLPVYFSARRRQLRR